MHNSYGLTSVMGRSSATQALTLDTSSPHERTKPCGRAWARQFHLAPVGEEWRRQRVLAAISTGLQISASPTKTARTRNDQSRSAVATGRSRSALTSRYIRSRSSRRMGGAQRYPSACRLLPYQPGQAWVGPAGQGLAVLDVPSDGEARIVSRGLGWRCQGSWRGFWRTALGREAK